MIFILQQITCNPRILTSEFTSHIRSEVYTMLKIHTLVFWFTTHTRLQSILTQKNNT